MQRSRCHFWWTCQNLMVGHKNVNPDHHGFMTWMVRFHGWYIGSDHGHGTWHGCHDPDGHFLMIPMMVMVHVMDGHQKPWCPDGHFSWFPWMVIKLVKLVNPDHQKMGRFYQKMVKKTVQLNEKNHFFGGGGQKFGPFFHFPKPSFFMGGVRKLENHQKSWSGGYLKLFDFDQSTWQIL